MLKRIWWQPALICMAIFAGCAPKYTGPWNMAELRKAPAFQWADEQHTSLYYAGEPFNGHPTRVFAHIAYPLTKVKAPAMVLVHGGGGKAFREWADLWGKRGYAAIAMDLAGNGPDGKRLPDGGPDQGHPEKFDAIAAGVKQAWSYHAIAAVIRAHSLLRSMPLVDADRTGITGISWGGYLTCIAAGLDDRFKLAVPVYGCGFLHENSAWLSEFAKLSPANRQAWIDNYDPSRYLPGVAMPMLFVNGTNDFAYPLDSYRKSYREVRGPRTLCITVRMPHSHPDGWAPREIGLFADAVLDGGEPLPEFTACRRQGRAVTARVRASRPIVSAALNYTTDFGTWQKRAWQSTPCPVQAPFATVAAELPVDDGITWFLTVTDDHGATVSTEHEIIAQRRAAG